MSIKSATRRAVCIFSAGVIMALGAFEGGFVENGDILSAISMKAEAATTYKYTYYPKCASKYTSFVDALKSIKVDSSFNKRKSIAKLNNISNYSGKASENTKLLNLLKKGKLVKSKKSVTTNPTTPTSPKNTSSGTIITNKSYNVKVSNKAKENQPHYENVAGKRGNKAYNTVINQFEVATNPRYKKTSSATYCNIFGWDVMSAMNVDLPHWIKNNKPATSNTKGATEMNANATYNWMLNYGKKNYGWKEVTAKEAQNRANKGYPTVGIYKNPNGKRSGHIVVIRPETSSYKYSSAKGPVIAQAGSSNYNYGYIDKSIYSAKTLKYFTHN